MRTNVWHTCGDQRTTLNVILQSQEYFIIILLLLLLFIITVLFYFEIGSLSALSSPNRLGWPVSPRPPSALG